MPFSLCKMVKNKQFLKALCILVLRKGFLDKVGKKAKVRNRCNQVTHLTLSTSWESDKNARKHRKRENQEVSPYPEGDHKAAMNRQESMTNTKHK